MSQTAVWTGIEHEHGAAGHVASSGLSTANSASNDGKDAQEAEAAAGTEERRARQWERDNGCFTVLAASMPIGNLLQRVSKLVSPAASNSNSSGKNRSSSSSSSSEQQDARRAAVKVDDTSEGQVEGGSRRQSGEVPAAGSNEPATSSMPDQQPTSSSSISMTKRSSDELDRTAATSSGKKDSVKKKVPNPIRTSHLSAGNPLLSVTPATPVSPQSSNSGSGETRFAASGRSPSSTTSSPSNANDHQKKKREGDEGEDPLLPEEQNRNSSLQQSQEKNKEPGFDQQPERDDHQGLLDSNNTGIVLEEPGQMTEEDEQRLQGGEKKQKEEAEAHAPSRGQSINDDDNDDHHKQDEEGDHRRGKQPDNEYGQQNCTEQEDHPDMPPPQQPKQQERRPMKPSMLERLPSQVISDSPDNGSPTTPTKKSSWPPPFQSAAPTGTSKQYPPKPSLLNRLPSQVISESPGSEYPPSPDSDYLSRNPSRRGTGYADFHNTAAPQLPTREESKSDDVDDDAENKGAQGHLPHMLATAVQSLNSKLSKPTDYRFPTQALTDSPPEAITEEPSYESPQSEGGASYTEKRNLLDSTTVSSPPSTLLDPSQANRFARDSPTSSVQSGSSINEYSTPAGFMKHRRNSSQNAPREVKETPNAGYRDLPDGKRKLNQYILTSDIGRGSFGLVQIAKDEDTGQEYAAKEFSKMRLRKRQQSEMIRRQAKGSRRGAVPMRARTTSDRKPADLNEASKNDLDLIRSEVAIMKKLNHPNVVRLYEVLDVQQDDSLFMIVELCRNGPIMNISMGQAVEPMSEDTARNFFRQMILAIEYLHVNGIIHRDIKPENILKMSDDQSIKLVDFGVSEMFSREDEERELRTGGSPAFMAPELCMSGHTKLSGKATDIWALGVTLYCMVVGHLPFESHQMLDLYDKIKSDPVNMPEDLSIDLKDLIVSLLEKDPKKRIRMNELREHPWVTCQGRDPLPTTEMNVTSVEEVTEHDLATAIAVPSVSYIVNAVRAATRWKRFAARRTQSDSAQSDGSTASTDMSRSGSVDVMEALQSHRNAVAKEGFGTPLTRQMSPEQIESRIGSRKNTMNTTGQTSHVDKSASPGDGGCGGGTHEDGEERSIEHNRRGSASSQSTSSSIIGGSSEIKPAMSFPQSTQGRKEKRPDFTTAQSASPQSPRSVKSYESLVAFPEVDRHLSQQEYLSHTGIDDSSVEVLRHYEDTTGHMLPRSAVDEVVRARNSSPAPPGRQTAAGPRPP